MRRRALLGLLGLAVLAVLTGVAMLSRANAGPILRTVTLSGYVNTMMIDARTSRAFISTWTDSGRTYVAVLDTASGALLRTVATGTSNTGNMASPGNMAIDMRTNRVFVTNPGDETMRVLDARTGAPLRTVDVGYMAGEGSRSIAIDERSGRVFLWASGLRVLDARSGAILRTLWNVGDDLAVDEQTGRVFDADPVAGTMTMLDARSGAILRTIVLAQSFYGVLVSAATGRVFMTGARDGQVRMFDAATGRLLRVIPTGRLLNPHLPPSQQQVFAMLATAGTAARVLVGAFPGDRMALVDARTGAVIRRITVAGAANGPQLLDERTGRIFVAGTASATPGGGRVWTIDARSGAVLRTAAIAPNPIALVLDERSGRVFVASRGGIDMVMQPASAGPGAVSVLDARSGAVLRTVTLPDGGPLAVDGRTGHAFVAYNGGPAPASDTWGWVPQWLRSRLPFLRPPAPSAQLPTARVSMFDADQ